MALGFWVGVATTLVIGGSLVAFNAKDGSDMKGSGVFAFVIGCAITFFCFLSVAG